MKSEKPSNDRSNRDSMHCWVVRSSCCKAGRETSGGRDLARKLGLAVPVQRAIIRELVQESLLWPRYRKLVATT